MNASDLAEFDFCPRVPAIDGLAPLDIAAVLDGQQAFLAQEIDDQLSAALQTLLRGLQGAIALDHDPTFARSCRAAGHGVGQVELCGEAFEESLDRGATPALLLDKGAYW